MRFDRYLLTLLCAIAPATTSLGAEVLDPLHATRITTSIAVDGNLDDEGWKDVPPIETWFETRPGDNVEPKVKNVAWLAYDDHFLYAAFRFDDPDPSRIFAPYGDQDEVPSYTDYGGVILDATDDQKTAQMFLANPRGIQYDAITSDASGEDNAPDFYWDSAGKITERGWQLEIRIPFSSIRYNDPNPEKWGILLYRNRPREFRYQMFTSRLPRGSNCFICNVRPVLGLANLPSGSHYVVAPYVTGTRISTPVDGIGSSLESEDPDGEIGLDVKWIPSPNTVIDGTINPDFSQVESDVAQVTANERFALFFPERRPFFLEAIDLFSTPINAVYTRTFANPDWGARATGKLGAITYTALIGQDAGGGSVIIPGSNSSGLAFQDFESTVATLRLRYDLGRSFVSMLYTGREIDGGGSNRVLGPDFRWQLSDQDTISGQLLFSRSETPVRPDLASEWDGRTLSGHAGQLWWYRQRPKWDFYSQYEDIGDEFRADNGFVPQVGYRFLYGEVGRSAYPKDKPVSRVRVFTFASRLEDREGDLISEGVNPGVGFDAIRNSFIRADLAIERIRAGRNVFDRVQIQPRITIRPNRLFSQIYARAILGDEIDFANDRKGEGAQLNVEADIRPTDHLKLSLIGDWRTLDVDAGNASGRLFTAEIARLRAVYTFTSRVWLRLIGQWSDTERDPSLYTFPVAAHSEDTGTSAVLAYKLNWQTVAYLGYSDEMTIDDRDSLQPSGRQLFFKLSYAFQR